MRSSLSSGMRVTLEPFASSSTPAPEPIFLTANGNLATPSPSPPPYSSGSPSPPPNSGTTTLTRDASFGSGSSGANYSKMDTTDNSTPLENTRSGSNAPGHTKPSKEEKADSAASKEKDSKYLEQFLQSMSHLPEFVTEKMSKIKGIDKAITQKSQAIKEASAYHVQMIHAKLTPPKKSDDSAGGVTPSSSPISSTSSPMDLSPSGSSSSFVASTPSPSSGSSLPPLPNPSPLTPPLPYTLTPSVIQPLATENLFNSLTYLLVGPVVHQSSMLSNGATTIAQQQSAGNNSISVSKQDMGIMPMHISPASYPPVGKKLSSTAAQAFAHPFASIPSPMELQSTAVTPITVEPPATLANDLLDFRKRFPTPAEYDLDQAEKTMKEHHAQIIDWQKSKSIYVNELFEQLDQLAKRADISVKKYDLKLRRGNFEVPATPIDRRRVTTGATATGGVDSRKRSYSTMVHELESRELQYALQNELRLEIEKQSANAITTHSTAGVNASTGASGSTSPQAEPNEPVYCICKKVSFGAMVACDNEDCEIEWFHFACVQLDTKPKGKWLCPDCRKKKKKAAAESGDKEKESSNTSSEKDSEKDKKDSSDKSEKASTAASKEKDKDKDKEKHDDDKPEKAEKHSKKEKHEKHDKHEKSEKHEKHDKKEKHEKGDKEKEKHKEKGEHHEKKQKKEK